MYLHYIYLSTAINHAPCIMILREINVLTKQDILSMGSSNGEEPRIITAFETFITNTTEEIRNRYIGYQFIM